MIEEKGTPPPGFPQSLRSVELAVVHGPAEVAAESIRFAFEIVDAKAVIDKRLQVRVVSQ